MSDDMYPTRLRWATSAGGIARHDGVTTRLGAGAAPAIGIDDLSEVDYIPHVIAVARVGCGPMRDMTGDEQHDALALLQRMSADARDAVDGGSTLVVVRR